MLNCVSILTKQWWVMHVCLVAQLWPTLHDCMDCSLLGSFANGIFQARILEWVAISSSREFSWPRDQIHVSSVSCIAGRFFTHWAIRNGEWNAIHLITSVQPGAKEIIQLLCLLPPSVWWWNSNWDLDQFSSVQSLSFVRLFVTPWSQPWSGACQASLSITNSWSLYKLMWCYPTISASVSPFSSHLQSFPASGSFQMSQFFAWGGQRIGVSASASVLPVNIQDWSPLGWTGWISLQSKGVSRVFSNTTAQKHQFFGAWLSL